MRQHDSTLELVFTDANLVTVPYDGSPITWRISAYVVCIQNDSVLLVRHKGEQYFDVPGGGIQIGEKISEGIVREALEEAGATVKIEKLLTVNEDLFYHAKHKTFHQTLQMYYVGTVLGGLGTPTEPQLEFFGWVPVMELAEYPMIPAVETAIQTALVASL